MTTSFSFSLESLYTRLREFIIILSFHKCKYSCNLKLEAVFQNVIQIGKLLMFQYFEWMDTAQMQKFYHISNATGHVTYFCTFDNSTHILLKCQLKMVPFRQNKGTEVLSGIHILQIMLWHRYFIRLYIFILFTKL